MPQKKAKLKINIKNKSYSFQDSALYRISTKKRLAETLFSSLHDLKRLSTDNNYNCFVDTRTLKPREIEHPLYELDKVHTRIASLLCRIKQPNYVHSGIKSRSHVTNAQEHIGRHKVLATDLQSFFQSTSKDMVFRFFHKIMGNPPDVAEILARLCTCKNHIPTGSRISMPLALFANKPMFDSLNKVATCRGIKMTVFVDDITFSGKNINSTFKHLIKNIIADHGHRLHQKKTKLYRHNEIKIITGVAVSETGTLVSNKHHRLIHQDMVQWLAIKGTYNIESLNKRLLGRIGSQSAIDSRFKDKARTLRAALA